MTGKKLQKKIAGVTAEVVEKIEQWSGGRFGRRSHLSQGVMRKRLSDVAIRSESGEVDAHVAYAA